MVVALVQLEGPAVGTRPGCEGGCLLLPRGATAHGVGGDRPAGSIRPCSTPPGPSRCGGRRRARRRRSTSHASHPATAPFRLNPVPGTCRPPRPRCGTRPRGDSRCDGPALQVGHRQRCRRSRGGCGLLSAVGAQHHHRHQQRDDAHGGQRRQQPSHPPGRELTESDSAGGVGLAQPQPADDEPREGEAHVHSDVATGQWQAGVERDHREDRSPRNPRSPWMSCRRCADGGAASDPCPRPAQSTPAGAVVIARPPRSASRYRCRIDAQGGGGTADAGPPRLPRDHLRTRNLGAVRGARAVDHVEEEPRRSVGALGRRLETGPWVAAQVAALDRILQNDSSASATNDEFWLLEQLARPDPLVVFDIGAHKGEWSAQVLQRCPAATVYAFEPVPAIHARLEAALDGDPKVRVVRAALSADGAEELVMWSRGAADSMSSAVRSDRPGVEEIRVPCLTGDRFLAEQAIPHVDVLKVDVEGHELEVLGGSGRRLAAGRSIWCSSSSRCGPCMPADGSLTSTSSSTGSATRSAGSCPRGWRGRRTGPRTNGSSGSTTSRPAGQRPRTSARHARHGRSTRSPVELEGAGGSPDTVASCSWSAARP